MAFLFDDAELDAFFKNANASLTENGYVVLDPGGAENNLFTWTMDNVLVRAESKAITTYKSVISSNAWTVTKNHHGYRWSDKEIIATAQNNGFKLVLQENSDFLSEFTRIITLYKLMNRIGLAKSLAGALGRFMPYARVFLFQKR